MEISNWPGVLADAGLLEMNAETIVSTALTFAGIFIFIFWMYPLKGPVRLKNTPDRRHRLSMPFLFVIFGLWLVMVNTMSFGIMELLEEREAWFRDFSLYIGVSILNVFFLLFLIVMARDIFVRGLRGFGLRKKNVAKDALLAGVYLLAVLPLIELSLVVLYLILQQIMGEDFQKTIHPGISTMQQDPHQWHIVIYFIAFAVVTPVFEETLFRGYLQTFLRGVLDRPWPAILLTSAAFTIVHPIMHWPAIFIISLALGYAYERSGSLWRAILLHAYFNGMNLILSFLMGPGG